MANQRNIESAALSIADLVDKARSQMTMDLYKIGKEIDNIDEFIQVLLQLDLEGTLKAKLSKATSIYANAHRKTLESIVGFSAVTEGTLVGYAQLNEKIFEDSIIRTITSQIRNQVTKGLQSGMSAIQIVESVAGSSVSNAQMQTLVNTTLNTYSRTITNAMMETAPTNTKYVYIGPHDEKTRPICQKYINAGRKTKKEIEANGEDWKKSLTDGGGFNCRHKWEEASEIGTELHQPKQEQKRLEGG